MIDDLHTIHGTPGERALFDLIDRLPMTTTVVAATRKAPAFDLSAWRVADDVIEIGFDDLRFTARDIGLLFADVFGAPMAAAEVALAVERTDGWVAALRLLEAGDPGSAPGRPSSRSSPPRRPGGRRWATTCAPTSSPGSTTTPATCWCTAPHWAG